MTGGVGVAYKVSCHTCLFVCSVCPPPCLQVAHIDFKLPVDVGDLVRFDSCVLYTKSDAGIPEVHVQVSHTVLETVRFAITASEKGCEVSVCDQ